MASERTHRDGDVRFIVKCGNTDFVIFNEWWVESIKERRSVGWFGIETWTREDTPLDFTANFSLLGETIAPLNPYTHTSTGYRAVKQGRYGSTADPPIPEDQIVGVRVDYSFDRENFTIEAGVNWPMKIVAAIVLVIVLIAIVAVAGWLLI